MLLVDGLVEPLEIPAKLAEQLPPQLSVWVEQPAAAQLPLGVPHEPKLHEAVAEPVYPLAVLLAVSLLACEVEPKLPVQLPPQLIVVAGQAAPAQVPLGELQLPLLQVEVAEPVRPDAVLVRVRLSPWVVDAKDAEQPEPQLSAWVGQLR